MKYKVQKFGHPQEGIYEVEAKEDGPDCPTCNHMGSPIGHYNVGDTFFLQATDERGNTKIQRMEVIDDINRLVDDVESIGPMSKNAKELAKTALIFVQAMVDTAQVNFPSIKLFWYCKTVTEKEAREEIGKFGAN